MHKVRQVIPVELSPFLEGKLEPQDQAPPEVRLKGSLAINEFENLIVQALKAIAMPMMSM
ncbi:hypothetical protein AYI96_01600 [Shewanella sp. MSW]|nr:hypothetical protein AYI96_01600 [Shewanella sp. MSW]